MLHSQPQAQTQNPNDAAAEGSAEASADGGPEASVADPAGDEAGDERGDDEALTGEVGVVIVGHAHTASQLLAAARGITPAGLEGVMTVDAGAGQTPVLKATLCNAIARADQGRGVLMIVDLFGASPCTCGLRERGVHELVVLSGLNLAMLLKLATLDRRSCSPNALAQACAASGARAVRIESGSAAS